MKCPHCPVAGSDCPGETWHKGLCSLAADPLPGTLDLIRHRATLPREPTPAPTLPPLRARLRTLGRAAVRWASAGLPVLEAGAVAARLAVCGGCPQRLPGGTCAGCGCNLNAKARMATERCPEGKWPVSKGDEREEVMMG